jgi:hypothetical protein
MGYIQLNSDRLGKYSGVWVSGVCSEDAEEMIDALVRIIERNELNNTWEIADINGRPTLQRIKMFQGIKHESL